MSSSSLTRDFSSPTSCSRLASASLVRACSPTRAGARAAAGRGARTVGRALPALAGLRRNQREAVARLSPAVDLRAGRRGFGFRLAGGGDQRRLRHRCAAALPRFVLIAHRGRGRCGVAGGFDVVMRRNAQDRAALERVDVVLVERVRVLPEQRQHHRVDVGRRRPCVVARDFGQRLALVRPVRIRRCRRARRRGRRLRRRRRFGGGCGFGATRRLLSAASLAAPARACGFRRRQRGARAGRLRARARRWP